MRLCWLFSCQLVELLSLATNENNRVQGRGQGSCCLELPGAPVPHTCYQPPSVCLSVSPGSLLCAHCFGQVHVCRHVSCSIVCVSACVCSSMLPTVLGQQNFFSAPVFPSETDRRVRCELRAYKQPHLAWHVQVSSSSSGNALAVVVWPSKERCSWAANQSLVALLLGGGSALWLSDGMRMLCRA